MQGEIRWDRFPDGFPNLRLEGAAEIYDRDVAFLASFHSPAVLFHQLSLLYAIPGLGARSFSILLPYFPTGTMERVEREGQVATAMTLARMLSAVPPTKEGPAEVVIYDIHALQERFYFSDRVRPRLLSAIPLLRRRLDEEGEVVLAFPDEGAQKRFGHLLPDHREPILCHKVRDGDRRRVVVKEGEPEGRDVVVVDDLIQTGGTLLECRQALVEAGAASVSAYATHGVMPEEAWRRFDPETFRRVWITDSCPLTVSAVRDRPPFEVLSLDRTLAEVVLGGGEERAP